MSGESTRLIAAILGMIPWWLAAGAARRVPVVADGTAGEPLANASVFDCRGRFIGTTGADGAVMCASAADYPLTVRYMGFYERSVARESADTVMMMENVAELPEVVVESKEHRMLHMLAYVREYSTLASYSDTVAMFREKMVDFMLPADDRTRYKGWRYPRTINARSYYHFSDANGLDSVSDRCNQHFSWSDWVGMIPEVKLPAAIAAAENATDTLRGRYRPVEIWNRSGGHRLAVDIDVTADTLGRRWVPGISAFSRTRPIDFERFTMRLNYNGVDGPAVTPLDLTGYSFNIESRGRGDGIFLFLSLIHI